MVQRIVLGVVFATLFGLLACDEPDPSPIALADSGPPSQMTAVSNPRDDQYITISVEKVTINRTGESPPNEVAEFRMVMVGSDGGEWSSGVYCPGDGAYRMESGQTFDEACLYTFDEKQVGNQFFLLFLGVDEDETNFAQDLGYDLGVEALATGLVKAARLAAGVTAAPSGGAALLGEFAVEQAISFAGSKTVDWFQRRDVIGRQVLVLYRAGNWGADQDIQYLSSDRGFFVTFHVSRTESPRAPGQEQVVLVSTSEEDAQLAEAPAAPPPPPASPTPFPQFIDRLVLFDPLRGDIMSLYDGVTIDLSDLRTTVLDVRAEVNSSQVGSVAFFLDDRAFCAHGRCAENSAPYIMNGDQSGALYGDWDWSGLAGRVHTISAFACTHTDGQGDCSAVVAYRVNVQR